MGKKNQHTPPTPNMKIAAQLPVLEKISIVVLGIGIIMICANMDSRVAAFGLVAWALVMFLRAFQPAEIPVDEQTEEQTEDETQASFTNMLGLPKVLWITSAICALGIALYLFDLGNNGYKSTLNTGGTAGAFAVLLFCFLLATGVKNMKANAFILLRTVPLVIVALCLLWGR